MVTHPWASKLEDPKQLAFVHTQSKVACNDSDGDVLKDELAQIPPINDKDVVATTLPLECILH